MNTIFKTGTFLTADNLNLAMLANGDPGIISGCKVYYETIDTLLVTSGIIKFDDGSIVKMDGTDSIDVSTLAHSTYYVYVVEYGNSVSLEINLTLPTDYDYVQLATVTLYDDSITIVNTNYNDIKNEIRIDNSNLLYGLTLLSGTKSDSTSGGDTTSNVVLYDDTSYMTKYVQCITTIETDLNLYYGFIYPKWSIQNIILRGIVSTDATIAINIVVNGTTIELPNNTISNSSMGSETSDITIPTNGLLDSVEQGSICSLNITICETQTSTTENNEYDFKLYSVRLTNS